MQEIRGQFARGFSIPRTSYSVVVQSRHPSERSIAWLAADQPMTSVFVPFVASAKRAAAFYQTGQQEIFSRDCAWWAFNFVSNWMTINFQDMMAMHVGPKIKEQQDIIMKAVKTLDEQWPESDMILEEVQMGLQEHLVGEWWTMADELVAHYSDNRYTRKDGTIRALGYPDWYLQMIGFNGEFFKIQWVQWAAMAPPLLLNLPNAFLAVASPSTFLSALGPESNAGFAQGVFLGAVLGAVGVLGVLGASRQRSSGSESSGYLLAEN
ncbi:unnamed protein product [Polarella glacialis]|uniref:Uncharacterized protein n=1 Tax=Polarella glacialis TaxID=89957 RepID=A0A813FPM2_POLGL|nr:unnamed protein product [Polarella glacialis]